MLFQQQQQKIFCIELRGLGTDEVGSSFNASLLLQGD
jgi:hypothetical protein